MRAIISILAVLLLTVTAFAPLAPALAPLDDDAGTGRDAGDTWDRAPYIATGAHTGRVSPPLDTHDYYAVFLRAGQYLMVTDVAGDVDHRILDARGTERWPQVVHADTTWYLEFSARKEAATYAFTLVRGDLNAQDDAGSGRDAGVRPGSGVPLPGDTARGHVDAVDRVDTFTLRMSAGETITATATPDDEDVALLVGVLPDASRFESSTGRTVSYTAPRAMHLALRVAPTRDQPLTTDGSYTLEVTRTGGDGVLPPLLAEAAAVPDSFVPRGMSPAPGGSVLLAHNTGTYRATPAGVTLVNNTLWGYAVVEDADGDLVVARGSGSVLLEARGDEVMPFARLETGYPRLAFAPDGRLYGLQGTHVSHVTEDGDVTTVTRDVEMPTSVAFGPDGHLYLLRWGPATVQRVDVDTGTVTDLERVLVNPSRGLAFDADGAAYVWSWSRHEIQRGDLDEGEWQVFARGFTSVDHLVASGDHLYVAGTHHEMGDGLFVVPLGDTAAPPASTGPFQAPPAGDLVISRVHEDPDVVAAETSFAKVYHDVGETRTIHVDVTNDGPGEWSGTMHVKMWHRQSRTGGAVGSVDVTTTLAPGETVTVPVEWDTSHEFGWREMHVRVTSVDALETNVTNNGATYETGSVTDCAYADANLVYVTTGVRCADRLMGWG